MRESKQSRLWSILAGVTVSGALFSLLSGNAEGFNGSPCPGNPACGGPCVENADCNCNPAQEAVGCSPTSGAGGLCVENADAAGYSLCICNPGFGGPNCVPLTATAPAASSTGLLATIALLVAIGAATLARRRRAS